jgi:hypothetical protein
VVGPISDLSGSSYAVAVPPAASSSYSVGVAVYFAKNIPAAASNQVTVHFNGPTLGASVIVLEYSGVSTLDQVGEASGASASASSGPVTTTAANELVIGAGNPHQTFTSAGSGFTERVLTMPTSVFAEDMIVSQTGTYAATAVAASGGWVMVAATFK